MSNQLASMIDTQTVHVDTRKTPIHTRTTDLNARAAHQRLRQALAAIREAERNAVIIFAEILRRGLFRQLGYASIHIYASEALGFSRAKTYEFIRLAESLEKLPKLKTGVESGEVPWTKASAITRVATPETEKRWLEIAKNSSRRELERAVIRSKAIRDTRKRDRGQGELLTENTSATPAPGQDILLTENGAAKFAPPEAAPVQSVTLRLGSLQRARFDAMVEKLMKHHNCSKSEVVLMALETFLGGGERSIQEADAHQDEQSNHHDESTSGKRATRHEKPSQEKKSSRLDSTAPYQIIVYRCETCGNTSVGSERKPLSSAEAAQVECDSKILEPGKHNRSSIPPSRRRTVLLRDGHRCRVQGCGSAHFLEVHHLKSRQDGGSNGEGNLVVLCSNCHRHLHERGGVLPPLREV